MSVWFAERRTGKYPILVAEADGSAIGYATYGPFRRGEGYAGTVEHTVYVARQARRRGVARALLEHLVARACAAGVRVMIGGVSGESDASIALHQALGFEEIARLPRIGRKFGRDLDLVLMALRL